MGWGSGRMGPVCKLLNGCWQIVCKPIPLNYRSPLVEYSLGFYPRSKDHPILKVWRFRLSSQSMGQAWRPAAQTAAALLWSNSPRV